MTAALSNIVFCSSDVLIIEFPLSPPFEGVYFKFISKLLSLRYVAPSMASYEISRRSSFAT